MDKVGQGTVTTTTTGTCNYQLMVTTSTGTNGWYLNTFNAYQKVNGAVYTYVIPQMFGMYKAQMYMRGTASFCTLEARTSSNTADPTILFKLAESWLVQYGDGDKVKINADFYNIDNPNGAWAPTNIDLKLYYINHLEEKGDRT